MSIITQSLSINNLGTTSTKSINLNTIRKIIKYFLKNVSVKAMFTLTAFDILLLKGKLVSSTAQRGTGSEWIEVSVKKQKNILILLKLLEK